MFERFTSNRFSGYMQFDFATDTGIVCFQDGHIVALLFEQQVLIFREREALLELFRALHREVGVIKIYRLESELVSFLARMCHGRIEARGQLIRFLDSERLLTYLEREKFDGCIRVYTDVEAILLFYTGGHAEGFFPDGSSRLHASLDITRSLAFDPKSCYDLIRTPETGNAALVSLNEMNLEKEWLMVWREFNM